MAMFGVPILIPARAARSDGEKELRVFFFSNPAQAPWGNSGAGGAADAAIERDIPASDAQYFN